MNILYINHYAGSPAYGMEFRPYYLAKEWIKAGHNVVIVGATFSHLRKQQPKPGSETIDGIPYYWIKTNIYAGNGVGRIKSMKSFCCKLMLQYRTALGDMRPDVVIASSTYPFDIYPARHIARHYGAKLVYEVHDLWPLSPMVIGGYGKYHPFIWLLQRAENFAYRHSHRVVSLLDKAYPHMKQHGLSAPRFCCIPNGYLPEEWNPAAFSPLPVEHLHLLEQLHDEGRIIIGYAGGHTQSTALQTLIEAAQRLQERQDIAFVLIGDGRLKNELVALAQSYRLSNIFFLPSIPKTSIPTAIAHFDICYAGGVHSLLHKYGTSFNKMTDYMLSGKPIVNSVDEPGSLAERIGCALQVEAENPDQVARAITQLVSMTAEERQAMGLKGRDYALKNLAYPTLAARFINEVSKA